MEFKRFRDAVINKPRWKQFVYCRETTNVILKQVEHNIDAVNVSGSEYGEPVTRCGDKPLARHIILSIIPSSGDLSYCDTNTVCCMLDDEFPGFTFNFYDCHSGTPTRWIYIQLDHPDYFPAKTKPHADITTEVGLTTPNQQQGLHTQSIPGQP
jgi:hypothetical protein